jgi:hypothetical protein
MFLEFEENEFEILLTTSLLIAAKTHEIDIKLPALVEVVYTVNSSKILNGIISKKFKKVASDEFIFLEMQILNALEFNMTPILPYDFLEALMSIGILFDDD